MRVIGVVDLLAGRAVHARAGMRERYALVEAAAGSAIEPGDAVDLGRAYIERLGITELYAADLDAILGGATQDRVVSAVAALGVPLWLDAGVSSVARARHAFDSGCTRVVVGLETLPSFEALEAICAALGSHAVALSLDLRDGAPLAMPGAIRDLSATDIAARGADAGVGAVIVIDLTRVGTDAGLDFELIARVRDAAPDVLLLAGGGVRGLDDLTRLADAGCEGALVASALHDGRIGARGVAAAQRLAGHNRPTR